MPAPIPGWSNTPPSLDPALAKQISGAVATNVREITGNVGAITDAIAALEAELGNFEFDSGFKFSSAGRAPSAPTLASIDVVPGTPTDVIMPSVGRLATPVAPDITVDGFHGSALTAPPDAAQLGVFARPAAPAGDYVADLPTTPVASTSSIPEIDMPDVPGQGDLTVPSMPGIEIDLHNILTLAGYTVPTIPNAPDVATDLILAGDIGSYAWLVSPAMESFCTKWLNNASGFFDKIYDSGTVVEKTITPLLTSASELWSRLGISSNTEEAPGGAAGSAPTDDEWLTASGFGLEASKFFKKYAYALDQEFVIRTDLTAKAAALEKIAIGASVRAAVELVYLDHEIATIGQRLDMMLKESEKVSGLRRAEIAALRAKIATTKAEYVAQGIEAGVFEQKVKTLGSVVSANRAAAAAAMGAAEANEAMVQVDEAMVSAARAQIDAAQAKVQALKSAEIQAELQAAEFKGKVQKWRARLGQAAAEVSASKAALSVVSAQNQALSQQVMAANSGGFAKVADAQMSVAQAQVRSAKIKTGAMARSTKLQQEGTANQVSMVDARKTYLGHATTASTSIAMNEALATINEAATRNNQAVATVAGEANSGVRQAAQSQATAGTAMTDVAFRYNSELAKAFAALNSGKLAGYRISTSKRLSGEMSVRYVKSGRYEEDYPSSREVSTNYDTITTHEESA